MSSGGSEVAKRGNILWNRSADEPEQKTSQSGGRAFLWKRATSQANAADNADEQIGKQVGEDLVAVPIGNDQERPNQNDKGRSSLWKRTNSQKHLNTDNAEEQQEKPTGGEKPPLNRNQSEVKGRSKAIDFVKNLTRKASSRFKETADPKPAVTYSNYESSDTFSVDAMRDKQDIDPFSSKRADDSQLFETNPHNSFATIETKYQPGDNGSILSPSEATHHEESWSKMSYRYDDDTATYKTRETHMRQDDDTATVKTRETNTMRTSRTAYSESIPREISDDGTITKKKKKIKKKGETGPVRSKSIQDLNGDAPKKKLAKKPSSRKLESPSVVSRKSTDTAEYSLQLSTNDNASQDRRPKISRLESERSRAVRRASSPHRKNSIGRVNTDDDQAVDEKENATRDKAVRRASSPYHRRKVDDEETCEAERDRAVRRAVSPGPRKGRDEDTIERERNAATCRAVSPHYRKSRQAETSEEDERDRAVRRAVSPHRKVNREKDEAERDRALGRSSSFRSCKKGAKDDDERDRAMARSSSVRRVKKIADSHEENDAEIDRALERSSSFRSRKKVAKGDDDERDRAMARSSSVRKPKKAAESEADAEIDIALERSSSFCSRKKGAKEDAERDRAMARSSSVRRPKKPAVTTKNSDEETDRVLDRAASCRKPKPSVDTDDSAPLRSARLERNESKRMERSVSAQRSSLQVEPQPKGRPNTKNANKSDKADACVEYSFEMSCQQPDRPSRRSSLSQGANLYADAPVEYSSENRVHRDRPARRDSLSSQEQNFLNSPVKVVRRVGAEYKPRRFSNEFEIQPNEQTFEVRQQRQGSIEAQKRMLSKGSAHEVSSTSSDLANDGKHFHSNGRRPSFTMNISDIEVSGSGISKFAATPAANGGYQSLERDTMSDQSEDPSQVESPKHRPRAHLVNADMQLTPPRRPSPRKSSPRKASPRNGFVSTLMSPRRSEHGVFERRAPHSTPPDEDESNEEGDYDSRENALGNHDNNSSEDSTDDVYYLDNGAPQLDIDVSQLESSVDDLEDSSGTAMMMSRSTSCKFGYSSFSSLPSAERPAQPRASRRRSNECDYSSVSVRNDTEAPKPSSDWKPLSSREVPPLHPTRRTSIEYKLRNITGGNMYSTVPDEPSQASDPETPHQSITPQQQNKAKPTLSRGYSTTSSNSEESFYQDQNDDDDAPYVSKYDGAPQLDVSHTSPVLVNRDVSSALHSIGAHQPSSSNLPAVTNNNRCLDILKEYTKDLDAGNTPRPSDDDIVSKSQIDFKLTRLGQLLDMAMPPPKSPDDPSVAELTITGLQLSVGPLTTVDESLEDVLSANSPTVSPRHNKAVRLTSPLQRNKNGLMTITEASTALLQRRRGPDMGDDEVDSVNLEPQQLPSHPNHGMSSSSGCSASSGDGNNNNNGHQFVHLSRELQEAKERTQMARQEVRQLQKEIQSLQQKLGEAEQRKNFVQESLVRRKFTT